MFGWPKMKMREGKLTQITTFYQDINTFQLLTSMVPNCCSSNYLILVNEAILESQRYKTQCNSRKVTRKNKFVVPIQTWGRINKTPNGLAERPRPVHRPQGTLLGAEENRFFWPMTWLSICRGEAQSISLFMKALVYSANKISTNHHSRVNTWSSTFKREMAFLPMTFSCEKTHLKVSLINFIAKFFEYNCPYFLPQGGFSIRIPQREYVCQIMSIQCHFMCYEIHFWYLASVPEEHRYPRELLSKLISKVVSGRYLVYSGINQSTDWD